MDYPTPDPIDVNEVREVPPAMDGPGIQGALNALPAEGGKIELGKGTYEVSDRIVIPSNVVIEGKGPATRILHAPNVNMDGGMLYASDESNIEIRDLELDGNKANVTSTGERSDDNNIWLVNCDRVTIRNIVSHDSVFDTININSSTRHFLIEGNYCYDGGKNYAGMICVHGPDCYYGTIANNVVNGTRTSGIEIHHAHHVSVLGNILRNFNRNLTPEMGGIINAGRGYRVTITGNVIGPEDTPGNGCGVRISSVDERSDEYLIGDNVFDDLDKGIWIYQEAGGTTLPKRVSIRGNIFKNISTLDVDIDDGTTHSIGENVWDMGIDVAAGAAAVPEVRQHKRLEDNVEMRIGSGNDGQIYSDGSYPSLDTPSGGIFYLRAGGNPVAQIRDTYLLMRSYLHMDGRDIRGILHNNFEAQDSAPAHSAGRVVLASPTWDPDGDGNGEIVCSDGSAWNEVVDLPNYT